MSLTVKAYLEKDGKPDGEIRRFAIPGDVSSSFAYLSKKIADIFPSLRDGSFSLFWKDPDGDMVLFSTDEEQLEAVGFVSDSLFKVYIRQKDSQQRAQKPQEPQGELHLGVVCDGCEGSIRGIRYKCVTCPDYDLCSVCEQKGIHTEHNMMKISQPTYPVAGGPFWACGPPPPPPPPHMGPRHGHPRPGEPFAPPPHFRRWMRKFMKRWHHKNSPGCGHGNKDDSPDDEDTTCDEAYLKSVGDSVAAMLDPMGIDVHVDVEHGGKRHCRGQGQGQGRGKGKGRGGRGHHGCMNREESLKRKCPNKKQSSSSEQEKEKSDESSIEADKMATTIDLTTDGQTARAQTDAEVAEELREKTERIMLQDDDQDVTLIKETEIQPVETAPKMDVQNGNKDKDHVDSSWTFVAPPTTQPIPMGPPTSQPSHVDLPPAQAAPVAPAGPPAPAPVQAPPLARSVQFQMPPQVVYPPANAHIAQALEQMLAMGFNNDGGWLLQLLESKNGDIIQVLDAIKPQPGRSRETNGGYRA